MYLPMYVFCAILLHGKNSIQCFVERVLHCAEVRTFFSHFFAQSGKPCACKYVHVGTYVHTYVYICGFVALKSYHGLEQSICMYLVVPTKPYVVNGKITGPIF
jgi:hypothetical protein